MSGQVSPQTHPGGCYLGFNALIDRKAAEQLVMMANNMRVYGFTEVNLCIPSAGGYLDQTYYALNMIEVLPIRLITWNTGNIQSAANVLFMVGDERYATEGSTFFFHQTSYDPAPGRITETFLAERLKSIQYDDARSAQLIAAKSGRLLADVRSWQNTELLMDTAAAQSHGLIHAVKPLIIPSDALFLQVIV